MKRLLVILALFIAPAAANAASCSNTNISNGWTCIISTSAAPGASGGSTTGINTSGSNLLIFWDSEFGNNSSCTPSDTIGGVSSGNTWTKIRTDTDGSQITTSLWYVNSGSPHVGATHVVTCAGTAPTLIFAGFKTATVPVDKSNGTTSGSGTTVQPGSLTPTNANALLLTGVGATVDTNGANSVNGSFTIFENVAGASGINVSGAMAYLTQSTAAAANPTWTIRSSAPAGIDIASFSQSSVTSGGPGSLMLIGVGK